MADIRTIKTDADYDAALARVSELMDNLSPAQGQIEDANHPDRVELDALVDVIEVYEKRYSIEHSAAAGT